MVPAVALSACADALARGGLVVLGTETVYGVAASLSHADGPVRLDAARRALNPATEAGRGLVAWHAPSPAAVLEGLGLAGGQAARAVQRLTPGPLAILIEQDAAARAAAADRLGLVDGPVACQDQDGTLVRVPDEAATRRVLAEAGVPVGAVGITMPGGGPAVEAGAAVARLAEAKVSVEAVLDVGRTRLGRASDRLRVRAGGGWALEVGRIFDAGYIRRQMARTVLFVCTGNTCRSPMAQAIAAGLEGAARAGAAGVRFVSAGVTAANGSAYSRETGEAVRRLGFAPPAGSSQALTASMVREADFIYAMTARHRDAVLALEPSAARKVRLLDPDGGDVADPVGGPQSLYDQTAASLRGMLERRRAEWDA